MYDNVCTVFSTGFGQYKQHACLLTTYSLGAAMVGDTRFVPAVVSKLAYNPLCMMRYENNRLVPDEWENVRTKL